MLVYKMILIDGSWCIFLCLCFPPSASYGISSTRHVQIVFADLLRPKWSWGGRGRGGCQLVKFWLLFLHMQFPSDFIKTGTFVSLTCYWRFLLCCPLKLWPLCKQVCGFVCHPQTFTECFLCISLWTQEMRAMSPLLILRSGHCGVAG